MFKKLSFISVLLFISTTSLASNLYMGAGVGPDISNVRVTSYIKQTHDIFTGFDVKNDTELSGVGAFGTIFIGYGKKLSEFGFKPTNIYLAGELNANISSLAHHNFNDEYVHQTFSDTTLKMRYGFGVSLIPGYYYANTTLLYGRLGYANGNFKISTSDISLSDINRNLNGFRFGFGLQQLLTEKLSARVEYSHISYESTSTATIDPLSEVSKKAKFKPHDNQVEFGLVYQVC